MTDKELKKLTSLLKRNKKDLEKNLSKLKRVSFGDDIDSNEEESDEVEEQVTNRALKNIFEGRLKGIDEALAKAKAGTYGVCENCGNKISPKLLHVDPESKLCQTCKLNNG